MSSNRSSTKNASRKALPALTPQRRIVLDVVQHTDAHPTAAEVFLAARERMPTISFATVYNSLRYLKESGLVREVTFGNGASRYDGETERHDHAICSECGKLVDFSLPATMDLMRSAARSSRFKAQTVHLTLIGLCPDCRAPG